jgi:hypothetical protein
MTGRVSGKVAFITGPPGAALPVDTGALAR